MVIIIFLLDKSILGSREKEVYYNGKRSSEFLKYVMLIINRKFEIYYDPYTYMLMVGLYKLALLQNG